MLKTDVLITGNLENKKMLRENKQMLMRFLLFPKKLECLFYIPYLSGYKMGFLAL